MPKRTNEFQKLVLMIQRTLAREASVTESAMRRNKATGAENEVDILIEASVGATPITIGVECVEYARKASIEWVQRMRGKHMDLSIDKSVLVSASGFSPNALRLAEAHGIQTMTLGEATSADWSELVGDLKQLMLCSFTFTYTRFTLNCSDSSPSITHEDLNRSIVYRGEADDPITLNELLKAILGDKRLLLKVFPHWLEIPKDQRPSRFRFSVCWRPFSPDQTGLCPDAETFYKLDSVDLDVEATVVNTPLPLQAATLGGSAIAHGTAVNIFDESHDRSRKVQVALTRDTEGPGFSGQLMIPRFEGADDRIFAVSPIEPNEED